MRFVVTGTGHSGTGYTASLMRNLGFRCGHEGVFTHQINEHHNLEADSSAMALPYLSRFDTVVFHQVRSPWRYIRSQLASKGLFSNSYGEFLLRNCPEAAEYQEGPDPTVAWAAKFWIRWNRMIEPYANLTYRIEDMSIPLVSSMMQSLGQFRSTREIEAALMGVGETGWNRHVDGDTPPVPVKEIRALPFFDELDGEASKYRYPRCE